MPTYEVNVHSESVDVYHVQASSPQHARDLMAQYLNEQDSRHPHMEVFIGLVDFVEGMDQVGDSDITVTNLDTLEEEEF